MRGLVKSSRQLRPAHLAVVAWGIVALFMGAAWKGTPAGFRDLRPTTRLEAAASIADDDEAPDTLEDATSFDGDLIASPTTRNLSFLPLCGQPPARATPPLRWTFVRCGSGTDPPPILA